MPASEPPNVSSSSGVRLGLNGAERVVFGNTFDGLRKALINAGVAPEHVVAGFSELGISFGSALAPAYPAMLWLKSIELAARLAFPKLEREEQFRAVGRMVIDGFTQTVLGSAVHAMARLIGPARTIKRMTHNFRHSDNFVEATVTEVGPTEMLVALNEDFGVPSYNEGVFLRIVEVTGGKQASVTREADSVPPALTLRIRWER